MFKVNFTPNTDSITTLTPSRLLIMDQTNNTNNDWNFNAPSVNGFNTYMNEMNPFDDQSALFDQKYVPATQPQDMMMPPSPQQAQATTFENNKQEIFTQAPPTPPSPTDTPVEQQQPKKQRKKLLEKNREAAYRCRQKKKKWVNDLEERSEKAEHQNKELLEQVAQLREESIYLRNLLLTHGNCDCDVVQTYLRRTSEQLSMNTTAQQQQLPGLIGSSSSASGGSSESSSISSTKQFYNPPTIQEQQQFMLQ